MSTTRVEFERQVLRNQVLVEIAKRDQDWQILKFARRLNKKFKLPEGYVDPAKVMIEIAHAKLGTIEPIWSPFPGIEWKDHNYPPDFRIWIGKKSLNYPFRDKAPPSSNDRSEIVAWAEDTRQRLDLAAREAAEIRLGVLVQAVNHERVRDLFGFGTVPDTIQAWTELNTALGLT